MNRGRDKPVLLDGAPSLQVAMFLEKQGFKRVHNLVGGIDAWSRTVDPAVPLY
jgi:rhodanese-related sulfurtransferase